MVSVSANNAILPGSVATKKAIVLTTFLVLGLAVHASGSISGPILPGWPAVSNSSEVAPAASDTSTSECVGEVFFCFFSECFACMQEVSGDDDNTEGDDDTAFDDAYADCDELWDAMCTTYGPAVNGTCADNEELFELLHCLIQEQVADCPATELCSGAMGFAHSSGAAVIFGSVAVASLLMTAVGMVL